METFEAVIGMEVHTELLTLSKMFCGCPNQFGGEPNSRCCPVCLGLPGALPVINKAAVNHVIRAALALNCTVSTFAQFDRKNYFYPDLPKGYQISEYDHPIGVNGWLDVDVDGRLVRVHIKRVHLEEDTGKLFHVAADGSAVDFNRSGVPLMEIVTEFPPDMHTADEARAYLTSLRSILTYIGVSDGKMEEGSLRCEPNLSIKPVGSSEFGTKTEIKNLNSFRAVYRGVQFEIDRQSALLNSGQRVVQETRGWNDVEGRTFSQRSKEVEQEYRYFPEPDLLPLKLDAEWINAVRSAMPELPAAACERFIRQYGLTDYTAGVLTATRSSADWFERAASLSGDARSTANWIMGEMARLLNQTGTEISDCKVSPDSLAALIGLIASGEINSKMAKGIFEEMFITGCSAADAASRAGTQISSAEQIEDLVRQTINSQPDVWRTLVRGDDKKLGYIVGQVMKLAQGRANPQEVNRALTEALLAARAALD